MPFFKCKQCNHIDIPTCFTERAGKTGLPLLCPKCYNDQHNISEIGDEVSCAECIYHTSGAGACSHPDNRPGADFWNRLQVTCYTSHYSRRADSHNRYAPRTVPTLSDTVYPRS